MPNIEVFGFARGDASNRVNELQIHKLLGKIWKALEDARYRNEAVVTIIDSESRDNPTPIDVGKGIFPKDQLFLRIWATGQDEVDDIVKRLEPLDIDIELPPLLTKFIERRSAREEKTQQTVDRAAENLKRDLGPYPTTRSRMLEDH